jgi:class 3 adenylate cyclase
MVQALQGLNLSASIGITTGSVYCGFVGAEKRCEYAMMGACVNLR